MSTDGLKAMDTATGVQNKMRNLPGYGQVITVFRVEEGVLTSWFQAKVTGIRSRDPLELTEVKFSIEEGGQEGENYDLIFSPGKSDCSVLPCWRMGKHGNSETFRECYVRWD